MSTTLTQLLHRSLTEPQGSAWAAAVRAVRTWLAAVVRREPDRGWVSPEWLHQHEIESRKHPGPL